MFGLLLIFTIISYYFYSTAYISLKRNKIKKGKEQNTWCNRNQSFLQCSCVNTWCNRNQSFLQCSCVENGERRNYPQCNMISPTMHTRWHSICVCVFFWGGILKLLDLDSRGGYSETLELGLSVKFHFREGGGILNFRIGVFCRIRTKISTTPAGSCITDTLSHNTYVETNESFKNWDPSILTVVVVSYQHIMGNRRALVVIVYNFYCNGESVMIVLIIVFQNEEIFI